MKQITSLFINIGVNMHTYINVYNLNGEKYGKHSFAIRINWCKKATKEHIFQRRKGKRCVDRRKDLWIKYYTSNNAHRKYFYSTRQTILSLSFRYVI